MNEQSLSIEKAKKMIEREGAEIGELLYALHHMKTKGDKKEVDGITYLACEKLLNHSDSNPSNLHWASYFSPDQGQKDRIDKRIKEMSPTGVKSQITA